MSEFRIHHDVNELLSLLHVRGGDGAEVYIDLLQKNRTPYVTTTVSAHSAKVEALTLSSQDFICMKPTLDKTTCLWFKTCTLTTTWLIHSFFSKLYPGQGWTEWTQDGCPVCLCTHIHTYGKCTDL